MRWTHVEGVDKLVARSPYEHTCSIASRALDLTHSLPQSSAPLQSNRKADVAQLVEQLIRNQ